MTEPDLIVDVSYYKVAVKEENLMEEVSNKPFIPLRYQNMLVNINDLMPNLASAQWSHSHSTVTNCQH